MSNLSWESNPAIFLAGTLRFRHHLLVSTYVSNTTVSALKGASCFQHHLQWLDGITSLILQVSQYLRLFFRSFLLVLRIGLASLDWVSWARGGVADHTLLLTQIAE